jgi:apolipoprotein D and lipocalin family protein
MRHLVLLSLFARLAGCTVRPEGYEPPATVGRVDLSRYAGTWYEIARYPNSFQDGGRRCEDVTATYTPRPDGTIGVVNRCIDTANDNMERRAEGYARPDSANGDRLRVTFFWPFFGDYWIIGLDPEYRWAVVGAPNRDYLWILSRTPAMPAGAYAAAMEIVRREGFSTRDLVITRQSSAGTVRAGPFERLPRGAFSSASRAKSL